MRPVARRPSELLLPGGLLRRLNISPGAVYMIKAGGSSAQAVVKSGAAPAATGGLRAKLRLPGRALPLWIAAVGETVYLGPFLGILARRQPLRRYGEQNGFFKRLIREAHKRHICAFVFEPDDVSLTRGLVRGRTPGKESDWAEAFYPVPDVVFDRGFFKKGELPRITRLRERLNESFGTLLFNGALGNKWQMYNFLMGEPDLHAHLPHTELVADGHIEEMLDKYKMVYIKPVNGNQGRHIHQVTRLGKKLLVKVHTRRGHFRTVVLGSVRELPRLLRATGEKCPFLMQEGIRLLKVGGRTADLRALVQKGAAGKWALTGVGVRMGPRAGIVSNLHAGGRALKVGAFLKAAGKRMDIKELNRRIEELAVKVATTLDNHALLGELGVDLGLDGKGNLWVIEVNMRPGRATFNRAGLLKAWRRSGVAPLLFSLYLWQGKMAGNGGGRASVHEK